MSRTNEHSSMEPELGREQSFHLNDEASANPDVMHLEMIDEEDRMTDDQNKHAVKGDDSDGKIDWTVRSFIAAMTLCIFYPGKSFNAQIILKLTLKQLLSYLCISVQVH